MFHHSPAGFGNAPSLWGSVSLVLQTYLEAWDHLCGPWGLSLLHAADPATTITEQMEPAEPA